MEGITEKEISEWKNDLENGVTVSQLSRKYNRAYSVIQKTLRGNRKYRRLTKNEREEIKRLYDEGLTATEISRRVGFWLGTVCTALNSKIRNKRRKELNKVRKILENLTDFQVGYIVGIIDGEGCIYITKEKQRYRARITIGNTHKKMIETLHIWLPFWKMYMTKRERKNWYPLYNLQLNRQKYIKVFCEFIYPLMVSKKKEVELMIKFLETKDKKYVTELSEVKAKKNHKVIIR